MLRAIAVTSETILPGVLAALILLAAWRSAVAARAAASELRRLHYAAHRPLVLRSIEVNTARELVLSIDNVGPHPAADV
jgi:hypothetical protein